MFDVDGTLVDSNDAHARGWVDALEQNGRSHAVGEVRRLIGMGSDNLLPALGIDPDSDFGKALGDEAKRIFLERYLPGVRAFPMARELVFAMRTAERRAIAATSADKDELEKILGHTGLTGIFDEEITHGDIEASKPEPDVIHAALERVKCEPHEALFIGDTPYDIEAAIRAGVACIALQCGGWSERELSGAVEVYRDPADLLVHATATWSARSSSSTRR